MLENVAPENPAILEENLTGIESFLTAHNIPATFLLIPTACAIKYRTFRLVLNCITKKRLFPIAIPAFLAKRVRRTLMASCSQPRNNTRTIAPNPISPGSAVTMSTRRWHHA